MATPLFDITIYYDGKIIKDAPHDWTFRKTINYIADFYHNSLNGYKPPKTGRICIHLGPQKNISTPTYFGSICSYSKIFNEEHFLNLSKKEGYQYILDLLHSAILEIIELFQWNRSVFENAYKHIIINGFIFEKKYNLKNNGHYKGQTFLEKTEEKSILYAIVSNGNSITKEMLFEKRNWFWYDSVYKIAEQCKWINETSFGFQIGSKKCFLSTTNMKVYSDVIFKEYDI